MHKRLMVLLSLFLVGCETGHNYAPVTDITASDPIPKNGIHRVVKGETLYEIAWRYGMDYRTLAAYNHIQEPYAIAIGKDINLSGRVESTRELVAQPKVMTAVNTVQPQKEMMLNPSGKKWMQPVAGKIQDLSSSAHKGIDIPGRMGDPIYAAAAGKVVYCGNGLRGYGNLIILKHDNLYLSAYAHNKDIFVKEGDWVQQGQKIAEMGDTGTDKVILHFEIRKAGKSVNPITLFS